MWPFSPHLKHLPLAMKSAFCFLVSFDSFDPWYFGFSPEVQLFLGLLYVRTWRLHRSWHSALDCQLDPLTRLTSPQLQGSTFFPFKVLGSTGVVLVCLGSKNLPKISINLHSITRMFFWALFKAAQTSSKAVFCSWFCEESKLWDLLIALAVELGTSSCVPIRLAPSLRVLLLPPQGTAAWMLLVYLTLLYLECT